MEQNYVTVILCMRYTAAAPPASGYELSPGQEGQESSRNRREEAAATNRVRKCAENYNK